MHEPVEIFRIPRAVSSTYYKDNGKNGKCHYPILVLHTTVAGTAIRWLLFHPTIRKVENVKRQHTRTSYVSYYFILYNSKFWRAYDSFVRMDGRLVHCICLYGFQSMRIETPSKIRSTFYFSSRLRSAIHSHLLSGCSAHWKFYFCAHLSSSIFTRTDSINAAHARQRKGSKCQPNQHIYMINE